MESQAYTPAGYCPRCGYRMDPGVCPECRADVPARRLLRVPPRVRLRRRVRAIAVGVLLIAVLGGAYQFVATGAWVRYAPTSVLLLVDDDPARTIFRELAARYQAGKLSQAQVDRMFNRALRPRADFKVIQPHPAHVPIRVKLDVKFDDVALARDLQPCAQPQLWIDDKLLEAPSDRRAWGATVTLPGLSPGRHLIVFGQDLAYLKGAGILAPPVWTMRVEQTIEVVDRPASEFVRPAAGEAANRAIFGQLTLAIDPPRQEYSELPGRSRTLHFSGKTHPVIGMLELRLEGEQDFRSVQPVFFDGKNPHYRRIDLHDVPGVRTALHADFRIRPGPPEVAIEFGITEYNDETIEWPQVPLAELAVGDADVCLADVVAFLSKFDDPYGVHYSADYQLRFVRALAIVPEELEFELRSLFPEYRFTVARMRFSMGWHHGPFKLMLLSDAETGKLLSHSPGPGMDSPKSRFFAPLAGRACADIGEVERLTKVLAQFVEFASDDLAISGCETDFEASRVQVEFTVLGIRPWGALRVKFDEALRVLDVELAFPK